MSSPTTHPQKHQKSTGWSWAALLIRQMGQRTKHFLSNTKHSSRLLLLSLPLLPVLHHHPWYNWELFRSLPADRDATVRFLLLISWAKSDGSQLDWCKSHDCDWLGWFSHDHRLRNRSRGERTEEQRATAAHSLCSQPRHLAACSQPRHKYGCTDSGRRLVFMVLGPITTRLFLEGKITPKKY